MTENIDQSVWINTRKEPLVTAARLAKGDMDVHIVGGVMADAKVRDNTVVGVLLQRRILGQEHYHAGLDLMELRKTRYGQLDAKSNFPCFLIGADTRMGKSMADEVYSMVAKRLRAQTEKLVTRCMGEDFIERYTQDSVQDIVDCFDELLNVLEKTISEVKNNVA